MKKKLKMKKRDEDGDHTGIGRSKSLANRFFEASLSSLSLTDAYNAKTINQTVSFLHFRTLMILNKDEGAFGLSLVNLSMRQLFEG